MTPESILVGAATAFWIGILTSISPCPLATNIVAISYIGGRITNTRGVLFSGLLYSLGRMFTYLCVGMLITAFAFSTPRMSIFLQKYMNMILGPALIIAGMFLLELLKSPVSGPGISDNLKKRIDSAGVWGAAILGVVFALSFCPVSAALFFGSLIPLSLKYHSIVAMPLLYGFGTALPVVVFAAVIAFSARSVAAVFDRMTTIDRWARKITGVVFIGAGIFIMMRYIFGVL